MITSTSSSSTSSLGAKSGGKDAGWGREGKAPMQPAARSRGRSVERTKAVRRQVKRVLFACRKSRLACTKEGGDLFVSIPFIVVQTTRDAAAAHTHNNCLCRKSQELLQIKTC